MYIPGLPSLHVHNSDILKAAFTIQYQYHTHPTTITGGTPHPSLQSMYEEAERI